MEEIDWDFFNQKSGIYHGKNNEEPVRATTSVFFCLKRVIKFEEMYYESMSENHVVI